MIKKFPLLIEAEQPITIGVESTFMTVQVQKGVPTLWIDDVGDPQEYTAYTLPTGFDTLPDTVYAGTYQLDEGDFVAHVYFGLSNQK